MKRKKKAYINEDRRKRRLAIVAIVLVLAVIAAIDLYCFLHGDNPKNETSTEIVEKGRMLGIPTNWPYNVISRHVWISEHGLEIPPNAFFKSVHIVYRPYEQSTWRFNANGTLLLKRPGWMATAHHVLEDRTGQYGYRLICPNEFTGKEPVHPIISYIDGENGDDSIICQIDPVGTNFPAIDIKGTGNRFLEFDASTYTGELYPAKIHLLTYPTNTIEGVFWVEVRPGVKYIYFKWPVENGESGSGATIDTEDPDTLLVVIREHSINKEMFPPAIMNKIGWYEGEKYGVGHLIKVR